jgi:putative hydrolase of the HAD superfamily
MIKAVIFDLDDTLISQEDGKALPFALEILTHLKPRYKIALISNIRTQSLENVRERLREVALDGFFDEIILAGEVDIHKPDPRIFEIVLDRLEVNPEEAVMVGDIISTDVFGGNRVGMRTVLLQQSEVYQRSSWEHPDHTVHSLKELLDLF